MAAGLADRIYDMILMHACLIGTIEALAILDDHAEYLIAVKQILLKAVRSTTRNLVKRCSNLHAGRRSGRIDYPDLQKGGVTTYAQI